MLIACLLIGCAAQEPPPELTPEEAVYDRFVRYLDGCSQTYQFDPRTATDLGETELGPMEREWRSCAYGGVRTIVMPQSAHPELYMQLIGEDQRMTDRIARGEMTRSERRTRLVQLREEILVEEAAVQQVHDAQIMRQVVDQIRGY